MLDRWQDAYHAFVPHLLQGLEADVPEESMPPSLVLFVALHKAHGLCGTEWEDVHAIRCTMYLGKELLVVAIPHLKDTGIDDNLSVVLIKLANA